MRTETRELVDRLERFFLESAAKTYAGGLVEKQTIPQLPGSKVYRVEEGDLLYVDCYFANGEYSGGQTTIFKDGKPVWLMQYHGWCKNDDASVLAVLKMVLASAYKGGVFNGGRGPRCLIQGGFVYVNNADLASFERFKGIETITDMRSEVLFWHRYQGTLLIPAG